MSAADPIVVRNPSPFLAEEHSPPREKTRSPVTWVAAHRATPPPTATTIPPVRQVQPVNPNADGYINQVARSVLTEFFKVVMSFSTIETTMSDQTLNFIEVQGTNGGAAILKIRIKEADGHIAVLKNKVIVIPSSEDELYKKIRTAVFRQSLRIISSSNSLTKAVFMTIDERFGVGSKRLPSMLVPYSPRQGVDKRFWSIVNSSLVDALQVEDLFHKFTGSYRTGESFVSPFFGFIDYYLRTLRTRGPLPTNWTAPVGLSDADIQAANTGFVKGADGKPLPYTPIMNVLPEKTVQDWVTQKAGAIQRGKEQTADQIAIAIVNSITGNADQIGTKVYFSYSEMADGGASIDRKASKAKLGMYNEDYLKVAVQPPAGFAAANHVIHMPTYLKMKPATDVTFGKVPSEVIEMAIAKLAERLSSPDEAYRAVLLLMIAQYSLLKEKHKDASSGPSRPALQNKAQEEVQDLRRTGQLSDCIRKQCNDPRMLLCILLNWFREGKV